MIYDVIVIGGGIVGAATAMQVTEAWPSAAVLLLEKEDRVAAHQSGHSSGVIHAGVYYKPGSLKARFCREGAIATMEFCRRHGIGLEQCGKLIVATRTNEVPRLDALYRLALDNGVPVDRLDHAELKRREPRITGVAAVFASTTGITDYPAITRAMVSDFVARGGELATGHEVLAIEEATEMVMVATANREFRSRTLVVCAGLMSDRLARIAGVDIDFAIVPFRGEYYRLPPRHNGIVRHLIYPVPDPTLPFLGVHLTRMIDGSVTVGPNAVLALSREGYRKWDISGRDLLEMTRFRGFWKLARKHLKYGLAEAVNSISKRRYLALVQRYCPELTLGDMLPHPSGVRAQAVARDGTIIHDFLLKRTKRMIHVCNAPSPAATSSIPIGRHVVAELASLGQLAAPQAITLHAISPSSALMA